MKVFLVGAVIALLSVNAFAIPQFTEEEQGLYRRLNEAQILSKQDGETVVVAIRRLARHYEDYNPVLSSFYYIYEKQILEARNSSEPTMVQIQKIEIAIKKLERRLMILSKKDILFHFQEAMEIADFFAKIKNYKNARWLLEHLLICFQEKFGIEDEFNEFHITIAKSLAFYLRLQIKEDDIDATNKQLLEATRKIIWVRGDTLSSKKSDVERKEILIQSIYNEFLLISNINNANLFFNTRERALSLIKIFISIISNFEPDSSKVGFRIIDQASWWISFSRALSFLFVNDDNFIVHRESAREYAIQAEKILRSRGQEIDLVLEDVEVLRKTIEYWIGTAPKYLSRSNLLEVDHLLLDAEGNQASRESILPMYARGLYREYKVRKYDDPLLVFAYKKLGYLSFLIKDKDLTEAFQNLYQMLSGTLVIFPSPTVKFDPEDIRQRNIKFSVEYLKIARKFFSLYKANQKSDYAKLAVVFAAYSVNAFEEVKSSEFFEENSKILLDSYNIIAELFFTQNKYTQAKEWFIKVIGYHLETEAYELAAEAKAKLDQCDQYLMSKDR